jgi:ArsR family transcriptional regulator
MERPLGPDLELLADSTRVRMLALLESEELSVGELSRALAVPQPTVSRHLKSLTQDEWLTRRTVGPTALVRLAPLPPQRAALWTLVKGDPTRQRELAQDRERVALVLAERNDGKTFFGRIADGWDLLRDQLFGRRFLAATLAALLPRERALVDLGCGTGELLSQLAPALDSLTGVDREPSMLAVARRRLADHPHVTIVEAALEDVPLEDGSADLATIVLVLHHLTEPAAVLSEARRILRPDGHLVVVDMQPHEQPTWRALGHLHQGFSRDVLAALAAQSGLAVARFQPLAADPDAQGPPLFLAVLTRTELSPAYQASR